MLEALQRHAPEIFTAVQASLEHARRGVNGETKTVEIAKDDFAAAPAISIDYAIMEKADNIACIPVSCGWSDIGSWAAMADLITPDDEGNRLRGETVIEDTTNSFVLSETRLVSLVGVHDLLVVDTPDALLVAHRDKAQEVRKVFNKLRADGHEAAKLHRTAHRPWGTYTVLEEGDGFKIKRIEVKPGRRLSLQAHHHRSEHWIVVSGTAKVTNVASVTGWKIRAFCRSCSSRCKAANIWAKTTSCVSTMVMGAPDITVVERNSLDFG